MQVQATREVLFFEKRPLVRMWFRIQETSNTPEISIMSLTRLFKDEDFVVTMNGQKAMKTKREIKSVNLDLFFNDSKETTKLFPELIDAQSALKAYESMTGTKFTTVTGLVISNIDYTSSYYTVDTKLKEGELVGLEIKVEHSKFPQPLYASLLVMVPK